jgi:hypothetical protein
MVPAQHRIKLRFQKGPNWILVDGEGSLKWEISPGAQGANQHRLARTGRAWSNVPWDGAFATAERTGKEVKFIQETMARQGVVTINLECSRTDRSGGREAAHQMEVVRRAVHGK